MEESKILKFLKEWSNPILAVATIFLAVATYQSVKITSLILNQQQKEEIIRYRAYISAGSVDIIPTTRIDKSDYEFEIILEFRNNGITPAHSIKLENYSLIDNRKTDEYIDFNNQFLGPGQVRSKSLFIKQEGLNLIKEGTKNLLIAKLHYIDYAAKEHTLVIELQFYKVKSGSGYEADVYSQYEEQ